MFLESGLGRVRVGDATASALKSQNIAIADANAIPMRYVVSPIKQVKLAWDGEKARMETIEKNTLGSQLKHRYLLY